MINLTPFLIFDGNCNEAMNFYQKCLGGTLNVTRACDTPMKAKIPPEMHQRVVNAHLRNGLIAFTATDWLHPLRTPRQENMVCLYINSGTYTELRQIFDKLSEGADQALVDNLVDMPFRTYGHLADKYGVHWFFQGEKKKA